MHLAKKCGTGFQKAALRHKGANLRLTKKCGAGFHKAAQYQPDVTVFVQLMRCKDTKHIRLDRAQLMRHKDANLHLTKKCFQKAAQYQPYVHRNQSTFLRLDRALLMRHKNANLHLTKQCGTGFQKAISRMSLYICFLSRNIDIFRARQGPAGAPQGCKPALDQEVRHWLLKSSSDS